MRVKEGKLIDTIIGYLEQDPGSWSYNNTDMKWKHSSGVQLCITGRKAFTSEFSIKVGRWSARRIRNAIENMKRCKITLAFRKEEEKKRIKTAGIRPKTQLVWGKPPKKNPNSIIVGFND